MHRAISYIVIVTAAAALIGFAGDGASATDWRTFSLKSPILSVAMPGTAGKRVLDSKSFIGTITTDEYYVDADVDSYSVEVTDLPGFAVDFAGNDTIYEHTKGALLKKTLSKAIAFTDVILDGVRGKRLVYDTPTKPGHPEMQGEARMFLAGDTLYVADSVVRMKGGREKQDRFFASLAIKK